jgi:2-methylcitrate dehydratase PrpD
VEALLRLLQDYSITSSSIEEIELSVPAAVASLVNRPAPSTNRAATLGSGQYVMAVTAFRAKMDLTSFDEAFLQSSKVGGLMGKVKVIGDIQLDRYFPQSWPGRVRINLKDGSAHTREIIIPKGEKENPMSAQEVEEKFLSLATPVLGNTKARSLIGEIQVLEKSESLNRLLAFLKL